MWKATPEDKLTRQAHGIRNSQESAPLSSYPQSRPYCGGCLFLGKVAKDMIEKVPNQHHVRPATAGSSSHRQHHGSEGLIRNLDVQQQPDKFNLDPVKVVENILSMQLVLLHLLPLSDGWDICNLTFRLS